MTREVLAGINQMSSHYFDEPEVYLSILKNGRQLDDARFLHGVLQTAMEKSYPYDFFSSLDKMTELKDTVPEGELQAYYETVLLSYTGFRVYHDDTLSSIKHLLEKRCCLLRILFENSFPKSWEASRALTLTKILAGIL
jgi:hypothetical protein